MELQRPRCSASGWRATAATSVILEHLDMDDATLVGASMGGNAIWAYVDQYGPERVRAIVIVDQTPKMLNSPDWPYGFYGYEASNAGTLFANGVPATGRG
jgi:pimeloyl-ACP methyl ester carboxylesterase